ncbi:MAG: AAA family ATPase [Candidatus Competibacteraceae bacterium]
MLTQINIRNFAIVDHLELELTPGMSALTGETGAGKSIIDGRCAGPVAGGPGR